MAYFLSRCYDCWGYRRKSAQKKGNLSDKAPLRKRLSQEHLLGITIGELRGESIGKGGRPASKSTLPSANSESSGKDYEEINLHKNSYKELQGTAKVSQSDSGSLIPSRSSVKETNRAVRSEDSEGNKVINEYVRHRKIGTGSYGKVVLHRSLKDGQYYAIKIFYKSRLQKLRVSPTETAMMDVLREVAIMKKLDHPNIVKLVEVIDDPQSDHFYMVLEFVEGLWIFEGSGPPGGIGVADARRYFQDVVAGLTHLHKMNIVHGDIKPENLLISRDHRVKICDFGVSRAFEDGNDEMRRSPGTPVFTAPECCLGVKYHGKAADVWALGCTLYCMVVGHYPYIGKTLQATYESIVNDKLQCPADMDPYLADLLSQLLCKDPKQRITLDDVGHHPWVTLEILTS